MTSNAYRQIRERLVREEGVQLDGFRDALRNIVDEFLVARADQDDCDDDEEEAIDLEDERREYYSHWFNDISILPAAYRIDPGDPNHENAWGRWVHIHVWEIETSKKVSDDRIAPYGRIADGDGPWITLHIINHMGKETAVLGCDDLMPFAFQHAYECCPEEWAELRADLFGCAVVESEAKPDKDAPLVRGTLKISEAYAIAEAAVEMGLIKPGELA